MRTLGTAVVKVDWVGTVQVGVVWDINRLGVQEHAFVVLGMEAERVTVLAQSVDVGVVGKLRPEAHILLFEHQGDSCSIEENLAVFPALDCKRKLVLLDIELQGGIAR